MNYIDLQKIQSKKVLIGSVIFFVSLIGLISGGVISIQENIELLGISLITIASIEFILSIVISIKYIKKTNKEIRYALYDYFKNEFTKYDGNRIFKSIKGEQVIFNEDSFYIENNKYDYKDAIISIFIRSKMGFLSSILTPFISIKIEDSNTILPISRDLIDVLNDNLSNKKDLEYFFNEKEKVEKGLMLSLMFAQNGDIPFRFIKNKEEEKETKKANVKGLLIVFGIFTLLILFMFLINPIMDKVKDLGLDYFLPKIIYSIIILFLILFKRKESKISSKIILIVYLVLYWIILFTLPGGFNILLNCIYVYILMIHGYRQLEEGIHSENPSNRYIFFAIVLMLFVMMNIFDIHVDRVWILYVIGAGIMIPLAILFLIKLLKQHKIDKENIYYDSKKAMGNIIGMAFVIITFGSLMSAFTLITLNVALDTSEAVVTQEEIVKLKDEGDYTSFKAIVIINGKEVELSIEEEQYESFEIGDYIYVSTYEGAFGLNYYFIEY